MPAKKMFYFLFMQKGMIWLIIAIIGILVFTAIGIFFDPRFFILALIWFFLIFPMIVAFLYFFYGMEPLTAFNTISHKLKIERDKITVKFFIESETGMTYDPNKDYNIERQFFKEIRSGSDYFILNFNKLGWLWLPVNGFESKSDLVEVLEIYKA